MIAFHRAVVVAGWAALALTLAVRGVRGTTTTTLRPPSMVETPDGDNGDGITRAALLEQALELQQNEGFEAAANMYTALLQAIPNDPDGLHRLGLAFYSQGKILRDASRADDVAQALFEKSERLVRASIRFAAGKPEELMMRGNLAELLRTKGDLEGAEIMSRGVLEETGNTPNIQASLTLATTLINSVNRGVSTPDRDLGDRSSDGSEGVSGELSDEWGGGRIEWAMRLEAAQILKAQLEIVPGSTYAAIELASLLKSNWDRHLEGRSFFSGGGGGIGGGGISGGISGNEEGGDGFEGGERMRDWGEEARFWFDHAVHLDPSNAALAFELAVVLHRLGRAEAARDLYEKILDMEGASEDSTADLTRSNLAVLKQEAGDLEGAVEGYRQVLGDLPENGPLLNNLGSALLTLGQIDEGVSMLQKAFEVDPTQHDSLVNLGTHLQEEGDLDGAKALYTRADRLKRNDGLAVRHALMLAPILASEEDIVREMEQLHRAVDKLIARDPPLVIPDPVRGVERVHFYLGYRGGNQRHTQQKIARMYALASPELLYVDPHLDADMRTPYVPLTSRRGGEGGLASPTAGGEEAGITSSSSESEEECGVLEEGGVASEGTAAAAGDETAAVLPRNGGLPKGGERPSADSSDVSASPVVGAPGTTLPSAVENPRSSTGLPPPLRVGFVSKFFGDEEPHGMLLGGVMKHLPRSHFRVILCPIAATPRRRTSPILLEAADEVVQLSLKAPMVRELLGRLRLDVLIYADMNSEPVSHFLGYAKLAKVQAVFWGNPITTGNPSIDYFVSAAVLEPQNRTALSQEDQPYSEQVVLLDGQGIWYDRPVGLPGLPQEERESAKVAFRRELRSRLGIEEDSIVYMCPQSLFKLRPGFDSVLGDILRAFDHQGRDAGLEDDLNSRPQNKAYLVLTEGRRKSWTEAFRQRLQSSLPDVIDQVRILPRTSAGKEFHLLLSAADVVLHPFPFGGSKTAADGISLGVPVVAMEGDALPGRMAFSLYKTMGLEGQGDRGCCVAKDRDSYVQLAVRLGQDARYRQWAGDLIGRRSSALWERRDVVVEWARFLSRAAGRPAPAAPEVGLVVPGANLPLPPPPPFQRHSQPHDGSPLPPM